MEFLRFIFSSVWVWLGFLVLVYAVAACAETLVKSFRRNRKVEVYNIGKNRSVKVDGASEGDVRTAIASTACGGTGADAGENADGRETDGVGR